MPASPNAYGGWSKQDLGAPPNRPANRALPEIMLFLPTCRSRRRACASRRKIHAQRRKDAVRDIISPCSVPTFVEVVKEII